MLEIQTRVSDSDENVVIVKLKGRIASGGLTSLEQQFEDYAKGNPVKIILDLHDAESIDSMGVGTLIKARYDIVNHGSKMVLVGLTDRVRSVLRISGLEEYFLIAADEAKALELMK